jgi:outer membrane immunogenic protein
MRVASVFLAVGLMSSSALAADILEPVVPVEPVVIEEAAFTWTGFYAGVNAGWWWEAGDDDDRNRHRRGKRRECFRDEFGVRICEDIVFDGRGRRFHDDDNENGPFIGGQIGANFQTGMFVIGVEGDLQWADWGDDDDDRRRGRHRRDRVFDNVVFGFDRDRGADLDWFGTARLRAGVAVGPEGRTLLYGTGGFAWGGVENGDFRFNARVCDPAVDGRRCRRIRDRDNDNDQTEVGFALGAGVEHAFTDNFTVGAEYQYINLGDDDNDGLRRRRRDVAFDGRHFNNDNDFDFHTVRLKANFLFGGGLFGGGG